MYLVTIVNNNIETVINAASTDINAPKLQSGTIKQGINCIDSFTFSILPNNVGYNLIYPFKTKIKVLNTKTNCYEFIGRVLKQTNTMESKGLISKSYVCESELAYLIDSIQMYEELHNISPKDYLNKLLQGHNSKSSSDKQFTLGNVTVVDNNDSIYRYIAYDTTKKNIDDDLIGKLGGEIKIRYENNIRYLDYLTEASEIKNTEIRLAKNIKDISNEIDPTSYFTRLTVLGAKLKGKDKDGNEIDLEQRLTLESVNSGLTYVDDTEAQKEFGIVEGVVIFDDVTKADILLRKGKEELLKQRINISNKVTALDLSLIGLDIDSFDVGNYYSLKHELLDIDYLVRIVEKSISIENPHDCSITLGDKQKDIKEYQLDIKKQALKANKLEQELRNTTIKLNIATSAIDGIGTNVNGINKTVIELNKNIIDMGTTTDANIKALTEQINVQLNAIDERLKALEGVTNG